MRHAYDMLLRLYPIAFRRRYGVEMSLDFADGWSEARARGRFATLAFVRRAAGDLAVSLLREWTRGARLGILVATVGVTTLLWALALRPWLWAWSFRQIPPRPAAPADVTEAELLMVAAGAMLPVIVVLLLATTRLLKRRELPPRRRF